MERVSIKINGKAYEVARGTNILEVIDRDYIASNHIVAAKINNKIRELTYSINEDAEITLIDLTMPDGLRIYKRSLVFVFIRACRELDSNCDVSVEHSYGGGLYCEVRCTSSPLTPRQVKRIEQKMHEIVEADEPFERFDVPLDEAKDIFNDMGYKDKIKVLRYRPESEVKVYKCGWMMDYLFGYMVPSTGYLKKFDLKFYLPGVVIRFPDSNDPDTISEFIENPKLFKIYRQSEKWSDNIQISDIADLNMWIEGERGNELIQICEAQHEKQIAQIADEVTNQRDSIKLILIAGPSSSGKTTFAQRLRIQLMVNGLLAVPISIDNYYKNRDDIPLDENDERDLESIDAIDIELFNEQMTRLIQGQEVKIPHYNFLTGCREQNGKTIKLDRDQPIIVEGIHGLNEKLTEMIPSENKYKIYISALTQLNVDLHNRIPTTDTRLIRRMVRDHSFRGTSVEETLQMWPYVRRGEEKYIFPYQESADVMFNSALIYELAVLKPYILNLLNEFPEDNKFFSEVNRLRKFLKYFLDLDYQSIPGNSILREFIGDSIFSV